MKTYIYALVDPTTDEIRYIGKSDDPQARYYHHMTLSVADTNKYKKNWIKKVKASGLKPILRILEEVDYLDWEKRERHWIAEGKKADWPLTNMTPGGAVNGYVTSDPDLELLEVIKSFLPVDLHKSVDDKPMTLLATLARNACMGLEAKKAGNMYMKEFWIGEANTADEYFIRFFC